MPQAIRLGVVRDLAGLHRCAVSVYQKTGPRRSGNVAGVRLCRLLNALSQIGDYQPAAIGTVDAGRQAGETLFETSRAINLTLNFLSGILHV